ncbi:hypothetical protein [Dysgonomonas sp. ZJ279]|uniref:hypothetical protein n=1 Tax=Dysgonomonas sp. ZJ279 TaxID=2709796 RepID=UPI0013EC5340|nr:hypothetical protein [Dysgonomonas sp. ZJ279]
MDLDNIKKSWQEREIKPTISEEKIQRMLDNRGKNALENLMTFEKWILIIAALCVPIIAIFEKPYYLMIFCLISFICGLTWQIYKYRFLKKINLSEMSILETSIAITKYKRYILREIIVGIIWCIAFTGIVVYERYTTASNENNPIMYSLITIGATFIIILTCAYIVYVIYRYIYMQNISQIEKSIAEIKDFEQDNG